MEKKGTLDGFISIKRKKQSNDSDENNTNIDLQSKKKPQSKITNQENLISKPAEKKELKKEIKNDKKEEKNEEKEEKNEKKNEEKEEKKEEKLLNLKQLKFYPTYESFISELKTWEDPLKSYIKEPNNKNMIYTYNFLKNEYSTKIIFPPKEQIFKSFQITSWSDIKVVILGQDPYPNPGDAMGLSFSVNKTQRIPQSLNNIYKCLENDNKIKFKKPNHGDLTFWAQQGVFLLNSTLTVECKKANSHQKNSKWNLFTDFVISQISNLKKNIVFLLWGNFAIEKKKLIDSSKHYIICNIHPSPLAQKKGDFTISKQFSLTNDYLKKHGIKEINWQIV